MGDVVVWAGAVVLAVPLAWLGVRVVGRWADRSWDRHVSMAEAITRHPSGPGCDCGGGLRDASGVEHTRVLCQPFREVMRGGGRGA